MSEENLVDDFEKNDELHLLTFMLGAFLLRGIRAVWALRKAGI